MARGDGALTLVAAVSVPLGLSIQAVTELAEEAVTLAEERGVRWTELAAGPVHGWDSLARLLDETEPAPADPVLATTARQFVRVVHDLLFSSPRWRMEVGYVHPMDRTS